MGILDGIVEWIAEQVMNALDLVTTSVLGALGCDMSVFLRYFPAAETMYKVFVALIALIVVLVPDVRRAGVPPAHECLVPAPVHIHGRGFHSKPAVVVRIHRKEWR